jgi:hypothetical protein
LKKVRTVGKIGSSESKCATNYIFYRTMVMQHDIRFHPDNSGNSSFVMTRFDDEEEVRACYESVDVSLRSNTRDTSNTTRDFDLDNTRDNTRQTVNTHNSILDFSKEEEDDDDENDNSILFDDLHHYPASLEQTKGPLPSSPSTSAMRTQASATADTASIPSDNNRTPAKKSIMDGLTFYSVTDSFVDSLCTSAACVTSNAASYTTTTTTTTSNDKFGSLHPSICTSASLVEAGCGNWPRQGNAASAATTTTSVSVDVWQLLGCAVSPGEAEMEDIWNLRTGDLMQKSTQGDGKKSIGKASIKRRLRRIHGLRMERVSGASRHGVTITSDLRRNHHNIHTTPQPHKIEKAYSMLDDPLANFIGHGLIDPIPMDEDGYDSDPEVNCSFNAPRPASLSPQPALEQHEVMQAEPLPFDETEMIHSVQVRLWPCWICPVHLPRLQTLVLPVFSSLLAVHTQFHMDIDMAPESTKRQRLQRLTQTALCQHLARARDRACQFGSRSRTSLYVEGCVSTNVREAQVEHLHTKAMGDAVAECLSHYSLFSTRQDKVSFGETKLLFLAKRLQR